MSRRWLPLACLLLSAGAASEPAAWSISGDGGSEVVLLGSVHYLRDSDYPLPARIEALYRRADALVMELDLDDLNPSTIQSRLLAAARLPGDSRLSDVLDPTVYALTQERALAFGIDLGALDRFEPWFVAITLLEIGMERMGFRAERGIEQYLLGRATSDGKPIAGLETVAAQVGVFDTLDGDGQQALLQQTLAELDTVDDTILATIAAWRDGELDTLAESLMTDFAGFPELYQALVARRNAAWIDQIESLLADDARYLVVVGALHLVGEDNVIELLRSRGIAVVPID